MNYRESYGMYACNGFCLITKALVEEKHSSREDNSWLGKYQPGLETCLHMGNIDSLRDWGHAKDYVKMQWMMRQDVPGRYCHGIQYWFENL